MSKLIHTPAFQKVQDQLEDAVNKAQTVAGKRMLKLYRKALAKHNTRRHKISIEGGMGMYTVCVNGKSVGYEYGLNTKLPIMRLLRDINDALLSDWDWSIEGERLN